MYSIYSRNLCSGVAMDATCASMGLPFESLRQVDWLYISTWLPNICQHYSSSYSYSYTPSHQRLSALLQTFSMRLLPCLFQFYSQWLFISDNRASNAYSVSSARFPSLWGYVHLCRIASFVSPMVLVLSLDHPGFWWHPFWVVLLVQSWDYLAHEWTRSQTFWRAILIWVHLVYKHLPELLDFWCSSMLVEIRHGKLFGVEDHFVFWQPIHIHLRFWCVEDSQWYFDKWNF